MCGILVTNKNLSSYNIKDENSSDFIFKNLKLRGPDKISIKEINTNFYFIHTLLSMTGPITEQPFEEDDSGIYCTFNGEIYNFKDFNSSYQSDGQCLIPLYKKYGIDFIKHLDGEFAIVLIDIKNNLLIVSTDIFGTRPLRLTLNNKEFGISTYKSCLDKLDLENSFHVPANTTYILNLKDLKLVKQMTVFDFKLEQFKDNFDDWNIAFSNSIKKRTRYAKHGIYIGMSAGYDSGAIACELTKQNIRFKAYSIINAEDTDIINRRSQKIKNTELLNVSRNQFLEARKFLKDKAEEYILKIDNGEKENYLNLLKEGYNFEHPKVKSILNAIRFRDEEQLLTDDNGAIGCSYITSRAIGDGNKIYLSGSGADEIFSDYGFNKIKFYNHSTIGGYYPKDLKTVFPWKNFYGNTQRAYLMKEEHVTGAYGVEGRYPFLDKNVVQEFLWLNNDLKNKEYKSPIQNYLEENNFPYKENNKTGFGCGFRGPSHSSIDYEVLSPKEKHLQVTGNVKSKKGKINVSITEIKEQKYRSLEDFEIIDTKKIKHVNGYMYSYRCSLNFIGECVTEKKSSYIIKENSTPLKHTLKEDDLIHKEGYYYIHSNHTIYFSPTAKSNLTDKSIQYTIINLKK